MLTHTKGDKYSWLPITRCFLRNYSRLGVTMQEAMLMVHILDYGWKGKSFPKVHTLVVVSGKSERTIRGYIRSLRNKGLLKTSPHGGRSSEYDLSPFAERMQKLLGGEVVLGEADYAETAQSTPEKSAEDYAKRGEADYAETAQSEYAKNGEAIYKEDLNSPIEQTPPPPSKSSVSFFAPDEHATKSSQVSGTRATEQNNTVELLEPAPASTAFATAVSDAELRIQRDKPRRKKKQKRKHWRHPEKLSASIEAHTLKDPSDYNARDVEIIFMVAWKKKYQSPPPAFARKGEALAVRLLAEYGGEAVREVVTRVLADWEALSDRYNITGYPSIAAINGWRVSLFAHVLEGKAATTDTRKRPQYESTTKPVNTSGWGEAIA